MPVAAPSGGGFAARSALLIHGARASANRSTVRRAYYLRHRRPVDCSRPLCETVLVMLKRILMC
ncbi:MAG: hypothetical protein ABSF23_17960, partial [Terracidiphilus sp.]